MEQLSLWPVAMLVLYYWLRGMGWEYLHAGRTCVVGKSIVETESAISFIQA